MMMQMRHRNVENKHVFYHGSHSPIPNKFADIYGYIHILCNELHNLIWQTYSYYIMHFKICHIETDLKNILE